MPWSKYHIKEKFAELDRKRRPKRRDYFNNYYHNKIKNNPNAYNKTKIRALTRFRYGSAKKCDVCGSSFKVQYHHYTEPYEVDKFVSLCIYHHILLDYFRRYVFPHKVIKNKSKESDS